MTIYHADTVEYDRYEYVEFVDTQSVPVLFNDRPSFSEMVARAREELHCLGDNIVTCTWIQVTMTYVQVGSSEEQRDF